VLILARPRPGTVGETRRVCHLISVPSHSSEEAQLTRVTALCGTPFGPGELELLDYPAGMPCAPCLLTTPTPVSTTLVTVTWTGGDEGIAVAHAGVSRLAMAALLVPMLSACGPDDSETRTVEKDPAATTGENGPTCTWLLNDGDQLLGISYTTLLPGGLDFMYEKKKAGDYNDGYFEPLDIEGYPAVQASPIDQRAAGICDVAVGITDDLMLSVSIMGTQRTDACQRSTLIAQSVITTIKQGR
jgi:hypothetical protein